MRQTRRSSAAEPPPPPPLEITLTRLTKKSGPFTKKISLAANGKLVNDHSACSLSVGTAERIKVAGVAGLGAVIEGLTPSQGLALGSLRADLMDTVHLVTKKVLGNTAPRPDVIARTNDNIVYDGPAFTLLDYDTKGMPPAVRAELKRLGGFWPALKTVLPALGNAGPAGAELDQQRPVAQRHRGLDPGLGRRSHLHHDQGGRRRRAVPEDAARALLAGRVGLADGRRQRQPA